MGVIVWQVRDFESKAAVLIVQSGPMLLKLAVVGSHGLVQESVVGHTKPVRAETRNLWSELNVVLGRIKVRCPDVKG